MITTSQSASPAVSATASTAEPPSPPAPEGRTERLRRDIAQLGIKDPRVARGVLLARLGGVLMAVGVLLGVIAYAMSRATSNALQQRDSISLALLGVAVCVAGGVVFLRYSLAGFLRLWLARIILHQEAEDRPGQGR